MVSLGNINPSNIIWTQQVIFMNIFVNAHTCMHEITTSGKKAMGFEREQNAAWGGFGVGHAKGETLLLYYNLRIQRKKDRITCSNNCFMIYVEKRCLDGITPTGDGNFAKLSTPTRLCYSGQLWATLGQCDKPSVFHLPMHQSPKRLCHQTYKLKLILTENLKHLYQNI